MAQPSINRAKGKLDKHSKMQLRIALSILYMQENKTENEKYAKKKKQRPRRCRSPCLAEGIRGRVRSRSAIFYMQENDGESVQGDTDRGRRALRTHRPALFSRLMRADKRKDGRVLTGGDRKVCVYYRHRQVPKGRCRGNAKDKKGDICRDSHGPSA